MIARSVPCILICTLVLWIVMPSSRGADGDPYQSMRSAARALQPLPDVATKLFPTTPPPNTPPTPSSDLDEDWPDPNSSKKTKVKTMLRSPWPQMKMEAGLMKDDGSSKILGFGFEYDFTPSTSLSGRMGMQGADGFPQEVVTFGFKVGF